MNVIYSAVTAVSVNYHLIVPVCETPVSSPRTIFVPFEDEDDRSSFDSYCVHKNRPGLKYCLPVPGHLTVGLSKTQR